VTQEAWVDAARRVEKPWGFEIHFALVPGKYCGKALHISSGHALSLQYHEQKEETVSVQSGRLRFEVGTSEDDLEAFELLPGESVHLTELDDVVRLEDRYGRSG
jgi:mannose-6-phosphate isomerase